MEREVEQNELPIVNKNTRKKQREKIWNFFGKKQKKLSKNGKNEAKTPDKQKNSMDLCGENRKIKNNSQKKQKYPIKQKNPIAKKPNLYCIYTYIHFGFGSGSGRVRVEDLRVRVGFGSGSGWRSSGSGRVGFWKVDPIPTLLCLGYSSINLSLNRLWVGKVSQRMIYL